MQVREQKRTLIRERLEDTANQLSNWVSNMYALALRLDSYRRDDLLKQQRDTLPQEINGLVEQRKVASKPTVQTQLHQVLASKRQQWQTLRDLDDRMTQASLQLEQSLTALATVYSQIQLIDAQSVESGRAERLQEDIQEQVAQLGDLVNSINEVYQYQDA